MQPSQAPRFEGLTWGTVLAVPSALWFRELVARWPASTIECAAQCHRERSVELAAPPSLGKVKARSAAPSLAQMLRLAFPGSASSASRRRLRFSEMFPEMFSTGFGARRFAPHGQGMGSAGPRTAVLRQVAQRTGSWARRKARWIGEEGRGARPVPQRLGVVEALSIPPVASRRERSRPAPLWPIPPAAAPGNRWSLRLERRGLPRLRRLFRRPRTSVRWSNQKANTAAVRERATVRKELPEVAPT
jgi:hypothetical protein